MAAKAENFKAIAFLSLLILLLLTITFVPGVKDFITQQFQTIKSLGDTGVFLFILFYAIAVVIAIPVTMINISMGLIYPFSLALFITVTGATIGILISYALGKTCLQKSCQDLLKSPPTLAKLAAAVQTDQWKYSFWIWLINGPMWIKNYGLAALGVDIVPYMTISVSNVLLMNSMHIFFGSHAQGIIQQIAEGNIWNMEIFLGVLSVSITGIAFVVLTIMIQRTISGEKSYENID